MKRFAALLVTALACLLLPSCDPPPFPPGYVVGLGVGPRDFTTGTTGDTWVGASWLGSDVNSELGVEMNAYLPEHLRVYSVSSGLRVDGEFRTGFWSLDGAELSEPVRVPGQQDGCSFIPTASLPEGWYVVALDLGRWGAYPGVRDVPVEDNVAYVRFHVGGPVWVQTDFYPADPESGLPDAYIGPVVGGALSSLSVNPFSLRLDGVEDSRCEEVRDEDYGWWFWRCSALPPETELTVRLDDDSFVSALSGIREHTFRADSFAQVQIDPRFGIDVARGTP